jgi:tRNA A-37 threonylcarbamoyl transferase component Bud32
VHAGTADRGSIHALLLEPVSPAVTFAAAWQSAQDEPARIRLLEQAARTIASHHRAGLQQQDIHLDNFLLAGDRLYTLDGGGIRISGHGELSARVSRDNLALFLAQFYPRFDCLAAAVLDAYCERRGWEACVIGLMELQQRIWHFRRQRRRRFLKKAFRDCTAFACDRSWRHFRVHDRAAASVPLLELLADPDASLQNPETAYLKQGNTCTIWVTRVGERRLVVKRYNVKGVVHALNRTFRATRAAVSWKNAHRLDMYGIPTARPVGMLERRFGPLRGRAWYICEYVAGDNVLQLCSTPSPAEDAFVQTSVQQTVEVLHWLAQCRISHGDMKGSNIILSSQGPVIIDLDALREHASGWLFRRQLQRDLRRFMRNWDACPDVAALFARLLRSRGVFADR